MAEGNALYAKLVLIMRDVANVPKNGYNSHGKYHYVREEDMVEAAKKAMLEHGVIRLPVKYESEGTAKDAKAKVSSTWVDVESGHYHTVYIEGMDINGGNKASWAAYTGCLKYELRHMLMVATGDDPENKTGDPERKAQGEGASLHPDVVSGIKAMIPLKARLLEATDSAKELEFVAKYLDKVEKYGADVRMSDKQIDWMRKVHDKLMDLPAAGEQGHARAADESPQASTGGGGHEDPEDDLPF